MYFCDTKEVTLSPQAKNSWFRKILNLFLNYYLAKWIKILLIDWRLLQSPCGSYPYLIRKYICIFPLVSLFPASFPAQVRYLMRAHHVFFCPKLVTWPKNTIFLYCPNMFPSALTFRSRDVFFKGPCILDRSSGQESVPTKRLPRSPYKWHVQWFYTN